MKKSLCWAAVAAIVLFGVYGLTVLAQAPGGPAPGQPTANPRIGVIDLGRIFKEHVRFKAWKDELKAAVQQAELDVNKQRDELNKLAEGLKDLRKGTQDYQRAEEELADRQAKLTVAVQRMKNDFMQREAKIYFNVYQEIRQSTEYFCRQYGFDAVLRVNSEAADPDKPETILPQINQQVVWYDARLDITKYILDDLNRGAQPNPNADRRGAPRGLPDRSAINPGKREELVAGDAKDGGRDRAVFFST